MGGPRHSGARRHAPAPGGRDSGLGGTCSRRAWRGRPRHTAPVAGFVERVQLPPQAVRDGSASVASMVSPTIAVICRTLNSPPTATVFASLAMLLTIEL